MEHVKKMVSFKNTFTLEVFQRVVDRLLFISDDHIRLFPHNTKKLLKNVRVSILTHAIGDCYSENYYFLVGIAARKNSKHILGMVLCLFSDEVEGKVKTDNLSKLIELLFHIRSYND